MTKEKISNISFTEMLVIVNGAASGILIPTGILLRTIDIQNTPLSSQLPFISDAILAAGVVTFATLACFTALKACSNCCKNQMNVPLTNAWTAFGYALAANGLWLLSTNKLIDLINPNVAISVGAIGGMLSTLVLGYSHMERIRQQNQTSAEGALSIA